MIEFLLDVGEQQEIRGENPSLNEERESQDEMIFECSLVEQLMSKKNITISKLFNILCSLEAYEISQSFL